ncbi:energy transducer TonB [candidate division WOR-3 bacterium]|nr:energy transducer TonB [candidate division WOR-3 bacterium]
MPANKRITFDYASLGSHYQKMQKKVTKKPIPVARAPIVTAQNLLQENLNLQTGKEDTAKETGAVKKGEGKTAEKAGKTKTEEVVPIIRTLPQPIPEYAVQPIYPEAAKAVGAQGVVFVQVTVGINGNVKDVKILKSFGNSACDEAAIAAAKKWRFKPGTINGRPSEMTRTIPFNFRLP